MNTSWTILEEESRERNDTNNVRDLERVLHEEWTQIPMAVIRRLTSSIRGRCGAVIDSNGGHTGQVLIIGVTFGEVPQRCLTLCS